MTATIIAIVFDKVDSIACCLKEFPFALMAEFFLSRFTYFSNATLKPITSAITVPAYAERAK